MWSFKGPEVPWLFITAPFWAVWIGAEGPDVYWRISSKVFSEMATPDLRVFPEST